MNQLVNHHLLYNYISLCLMIQEPITNIMCMMLSYPFIQHFPQNKSSHIDELSIQKSWLKFTFCSSTMLVFLRKKKSLPGWLNMLNHNCSHGKKHGEIVSSNRFPPKKPPKNPQSSLGGALMITFLAPPPMCRAAWYHGDTPITCSNFFLGTFSDKPMWFQPTINGLVLLGKS